ncbi:hypothetical protein FNYG_15909 [Fusarium nygamai]|uniref:Cytochrome b5 heme-binding domain-containing protein n=1 Tax=Gibberella nygamai TaxID=42673 RepID=A0A2K0U0J4_GIBNY|nr:hypothetical protein FNYG_15909 [Fusarium nygamai]
MYQELTLAEVAKHNTKDIYIVIRNKVYNVTSFVDDHPGSADILIDIAGQDCTEAYDDAGHSDEAHEILPELEIGKLSAADAITKASLVPQVVSNVTKPVHEAIGNVLKPNVFQESELQEKTEVSHNVTIYRFKLPPEDSILSLPIGQHISGLITQHLAGLEIGDYIRVRGPKGAFTYTQNMVRHFGMIAGGTGLTPMLQIIRTIVRGRPDGDKTEVDFIFANVNEKDILLRQELEQIAKDNSGIRIHHVLNNPPEGWTGGVGFVNADMISKWLPAPADDIKILLCGPPPMISAMKNITESLGYQKARSVSKLEDQIFAF